MTQVDVDLPPPARIVEGAQRAYRRRADDVDQSGDRSGQPGCFGQGLTEVVPAGRVGRERVASSLLGDGPGQVRFAVDAHHISARLHECMNRLAPDAGAAEDDDGTALKPQ